MVLTPIQRPALEAKDYGFWRLDEWRKATIQSLLQKTIKKRKTLPKPAFPLRPFRGYAQHIAGPWY